MAINRDRLSFRLFRLIEGEAEGQFAIAALMVIALATLLCWIALRLL